jgi:hypothetical protein
MIITADKEEEEEEEEEEEADDSRSSWFQKALNAEKRRVVVASCRKE